MSKKSTGVKQEIKTTHLDSIDANLKCEGTPPPIGQDTAGTCYPYDKHVFASGATSSQQVTRYDLCIMELFTRIANIFRYGASKHGDVNYQKAICTDEPIMWQSHRYETVSLDVEFARDRFNHGFKHLMNIKTGDEPDHDNIGAVGWCLSLMCWVESHGFTWNRILNPRFVGERRLYYHKGSGRRWVLNSNYILIPDNDSQIDQEYDEDKLQR